MTGSGYRVAASVVIDQFVLERCIGVGQGVPERAGFHPGVRWREADQGP